MRGGSASLPKLRRCAGASTPRRFPLKSSQFRNKNGEATMRDARGLWTRRGFSLLAGLVGAALYAAPSPAQEEVKLGALMDVTGPIANFMPALLAAQQLAVDEVNANGGMLGGKKLRLVTVDTQGTEQ